jgi:hypothetical protein
LNRISPFSEKSGGDLWTTLSEDAKKEILRNVQSRFLGPRENLRFKANGRSYAVNFNKEDIRFPFRPVKGHLMGIDGAGRDVFARVLYGLRTSMSFGLLLVFASMVVGIITGALQAKGISLGITPDIHYEKKETFLSPGESILLYTDGVIEAENERNELYGYDRMVGHIENSKGPPWGEGLTNEIGKWRGNAKANDDLTLLEIWRD